MLTNGLEITTSTYSFQVAYADTDAGGVMYHSRYLEHCERARGHFFNYFQMRQRQLLEEAGIVFVVSECKVRYVKPARFEDCVTVETELTSLGGANVDFNQVAYVGNHKVFISLAKLVCVDSTTLKPKRIPLDLHEKLSALVSQSS